jgi:hypothetical protein
VSSSDSTSTHIHASGDDLADLYLLTAMTLPCLCALHEILGNA